MFEKASRLKLRFNSPSGLLHVEDVWDLPLLPPKRGTKANLDDLAKMLDKEIRDSSTESFVLKKSEANEEMQLKFDIVRHIIGVRLIENEAKKNALKAKEKKEQIMSIIADKEVESLKGMGIDELKALINSL